MDGRINDPPGLTAAKWEVRKNWLKIAAYENKLKMLDPTLPEWEETAQELYKAQELQTQLAYAAIVANARGKKRGVTLDTQGIITALLSQVGN